MSKLYIIVQLGNLGPIEMLVKHHLSEVIYHVADAAARDGNPKIVRIFSVDEFGKVQHLEVQYKNGKFVLEPIPGEG